jgi:hypothetical protein
MHIGIGIIAVLIGIYTLSWAWSLARRRNWAGAIWSAILALASTGLTLFYLFRHKFYP